MVFPEGDASLRVSMKRPVRTLGYWHLANIAITTRTELAVMSTITRWGYEGVDGAIFARVRKNLRTFHPEKFDLATTVAVGVLSVVIHRCSNRG
jgi:hypothetical protein